MFIHLSAAALIFISFSSDDSSTYLGRLLDRNVNAVSRKQKELLNFWALGVVGVSVARFKLYTGAKEKDHSRFVACAHILTYIHTNLILVLIRLFKKSLLL